MRLATVALVMKDVEPGWPLIDDDVPLGKEYVVDLDSIEVLTLVNSDTGKKKQLPCVAVLSPGPPGILPCMAFGIVPAVLPRVDPGVEYPVLPLPFVMNVCRIGAMERCCAYLSKQPGHTAYFCAKRTPYEAVIMERLFLGAMKSKGDNCSGPPLFEAQR